VSGIPKRNRQLESVGTSAVLHELTIPGDKSFMVLHPCIVQIMDAVYAVGPSIRALRAPPSDYTREPNSHPAVMRKSRRLWRHYRSSSVGNQPLLTHLSRHVKHLLPLAVSPPQPIDRPLNPLAPAPAPVLTPLAPVPAPLVVLPKHVLRDQVSLIMKYWVFPELLQPEKLRLRTVNWL